MTQIGLDAFNDYGQMVAWTTDLKTGAPLEGVGIQPNVGVGGKTGEDGIARFDIPSGATYLVAQKGSDLAILPRSTYYYDDGPWVSIPPKKKSNLILPCNPGQSGVRPAPSIVPHAMSR